MSAYRFNLPDVGEGLSEGEIVHWHVAQGDQVKADQLLVDVQTDKAVVEIPAPVAGVITELGGQPGDVLPIGGLLAVIESAATSPESAPKAGPEKPVPVAPAAPVAAAPVAPQGRVRASPATRKRALELDIDLATVRGTGDHGRITKQDLESAAAGPPAGAEVPAPVARGGADRVEPLRGLRRQIANTMTAAWREVPHILTMQELDATRLVAARDSLRAEFENASSKFSYLPLFVKACVAGLERHPRFNASLDMDTQQVIYRHRINIGIATATPDGLIVPVIHDADTKSIAMIASEIEALADSARARKVTVAELSEGTFTISNFGSYGGHMGTPIIRPPEVAIAGFGQIREAVIPIDGAPAVRPVLPMVVSCDHRLNDGEHLGGFVGTIATYLKDPVRLLGVR